MKLSPSDSLLMAFKAINLPEPKPEYHFHPTRKWRLDLAFLEPYMIAIEIHGSVWTQGRHTRGSGFIKDREKMNAAQKLGWTVLEYTTHQCVDDPMKIAEEIKELMRIRSKD